MGADGPADAPREKGDITDIEQESTAAAARPTAENGQ